MRFVQGQEYENMQHIHKIMNMLHRNRVSRGECIYGRPYMFYPRFSIPNVGASIARPQGKHQRIEWICSFLVSAQETNQRKRPRRGAEKLLPQKNVQLTAKRNDTERRRAVTTGTALCTARPLLGSSPAPLDR